MKVIKTYRVKLKPTRQQKQLFSQWLGTCRMLYNTSLDYKRWLYKSYGVSKSKYDLIKELPGIRSDTDWINNVYSQTLQDVEERLDRSYINFYQKRAGYPKFAKKYKYCSFAFKQGVKLHPNTYRIQLPKIGKVKFFKDRLPEGEVKRTTIIQKADGWYCSITCEEEHIPFKRTTATIGVDLGVTDYATISHSKDRHEKIANPRILKKYERELRLAQRSLSRKKKGSSNWKKAKYKVQLIHLKIKNTRNDHQHKNSTTLIRKNQSIGIETLGIQGMVRRCKPKQDENDKYLPNGQSAKSGLNKSISDCAWGEFVRQLEYKAKWNGRTIVKADRFYPSTKECSQCHHVNKWITLKDRFWACENCGTLHDREHNAGDNLREMAVGHTVSACGDIAPPLLRQQLSGQVRQAQEPPPL